MNTKNITLSNLNQFHGSDQFFYSQLFPNIKYTQGVQWLGSNGAGWLQDAILSHIAHNPKVKNQEFVAASLIVKKDQVAVLTFDDGNGNVLDTQKFEYVDFPIHNEKVKFICTSQVLMLASEY